MIDQTVEEMLEEEVTVGETTYAFNTQSRAIEVGMLVKRLMWVLISHRLNGHLDAVLQGSLGQGFLPPFCRRTADLSFLASSTKYFKAVAVPKRRPPRIAPMVNAA